MVCKQSIFTDKPPLSTYYREYRTNQNSTIESTLSQCFSTHRVKYKTFPTPTWHLLSCWGFMISNVWYLKTNTFTKLHEKPRHSHTMECSAYFRKHTKLPSHTQKRGKKRKVHAHTYCHTHRFGGKMFQVKMKQRYTEAKWEIRGCFHSNFVSEGVTQILTRNCAFWMQSTPEYTVHF